MAPVAGSRVKATPEAESSSRFPNTMEHTFTAVPRSCGIRSVLRYTTARGAFHDSNTAMIEARSCSRGSCGKGYPVCSRMICWKRPTTAVRSSAVSSTSLLTPRSFFASSSTSSNRAASTSSTVRPYICSRRR